jgi:hypothetical protein
MPRLRAHSQGIAIKLREFRLEISSLARIPKAVAESDAPQVNWFAETTFQFTRRVHDKVCNVSIGEIEDIFRIRTTAVDFDMEQPPDFMRKATWLWGDFRVRGRSISDHVRPGLVKQKELRWRAAQRQNAGLKEKAELRAVGLAELDSRKRQQVNGWVGVGADRRRLDNEELLTLVGWKTVDFALGSSTTGFTSPAVKNQFYLRNTEKATWTAQFAALADAGLLDKKGLTPLGLSSQKCEDCRLKPPSFGMAVDLKVRKFGHRRRRWCGTLKDGALTAGCATQHPGAVHYGGRLQRCRYN